MPERLPGSVFGTSCHPIRVGILTVFCCLHWMDNAIAGGGPENLALVVNARSWASLTVANHYARLRQIPHSNVIYLDWPDPVLEVDVDAFRERILQRVLNEINKRGLASQIDYVVYSSDFPYAVDVSADVQGVGLPKQLTPTGSINGLTYLAQRTLVKDPRYLQLDVNRYMRLPDAPASVEPTVGFRGWYTWGELGELLEAGEDRYLISTMLAMTSGRGNSVTEAIRYLRKSASADGTHPGGTIYYARNNDIRSRARDGDFAKAVSQLRKIGVRAEIVDDVMPRVKRDVQGAMMGTDKFDWSDSESRILPGAICDHFTSLGGILRSGAGQTPLTEFLRYGAAGASGTVREPYAIGQKFPSPQIHVHYARGCSLGEAFYQSVFGPYQLLIVGDPLCRPWADIPAVEVGGVETGATVAGSITLTPSARTNGGAKVDRYELFVDGKRVARAIDGESFTLDTATLADGYHELRVVGLEASPIESQGRVILPIRVNNHGHVCELTASTTKFARWGEPLHFDVNAPGARRIVLLRGSQPIGIVNNERGRLSFHPQLFGQGPADFRAVALGPQTAGILSQSAPIDLTVVPAAPLPAQKLSAGVKLAPGLRLKIDGQAASVVRGGKAADWFPTGRGIAESAFELSGYFDVPEQDVYQFQLLHQGPVTVSVDDRLVGQAEVSQAPQMLYVPAMLARGLHRLEIRGQLAANPVLTIWFGGSGARELERLHFQHAR